jgi:hypothetical protein
MILVAIIEAIRDHEVPTYVRMNEAQSVAWTNSCNHTFLEYVPKELPMFPVLRVTVGGLPIRLDPKLWPSTVVFHNAEGKAVARIQSLAIPCGFDKAPGLCNCNSQAEVDARIRNEGWLFE